MDGPAIGRFSVLTAFDKKTEQLWTQADRELADIARLSDDWDGLGALRPPPGIVSSAVALFRDQYLYGNLGPPSAVVPTALGRISFEWDFNNLYVEAQIVRPGYVRWMIKASGAPTWHSGDVAILPPDIQVRTRSVACDPPRSTSDQLCVV